LPCNEFGNYEYHFAVVGNTNVSASTNLVYADLSGNVVDNTDDKPVDVVTPVEPKPEPTPVEPEDKPVDN
ncbi:hypothetical protein, partial [Campylobacter sp. MG1]